VRQPLKELSGGPVEYPHDPIVSASDDNSALLSESDLPGEWLLHKARWKMQNLEAVVNLVEVESIHGIVNEYDPHLEGNGAGRAAC